jgi:hypothetical protein
MLQAVCHLDFNLFVTVSEPSLKMRSSRLSLRQRVIQRNSQLMHRREVYRQRKSEDEVLN